MANILYIIYSGFIVSLVWFVAGGVLYMNPVVSKIYKKLNQHPSMKTFDNQKKYLINMYLLGVLIPCLIAAFVYNFLTPISILNFGLILVGIRMVPRLIDMWMQTSYPNILLIIELINGMILSFIAAFVFSLL